MANNKIFGPTSFPEAEVVHVAPELEKTFIILNETYKLSGGYHIGPAAVCSKIRTGLIERGFGYAGWANSLQGAVFLREELLRRPDLVVLNGEGTIHHNAPRAFMLLGLAAYFKKAGSTVVLINTGWDKNSDILGDYLSCFDLVSGRDHNAVERMCKWRSDTRIVADLSISVFPESDEPPCEVINMWRIGVIDSVAGGVGEALQDYSSRENAHFFVMGAGRPGPLRRRFHERSLPRSGWPEILREDHIGEHDGWITGRYHGLIATICYGKPCVTLSSNTSKIESLLEMLELSNILLPSAWPELPPDDQRNEIMTRLKFWNKDKWNIVKNRIAELRRDIEKLFDDITTIVDGAK